MGVGGGPAKGARGGARHFSRRPGSCPTSLVSIVPLLTQSPRQSNSFILATFVVTVYARLCFQRKNSFVRNDENLRTEEGTRSSVLQTETSFRMWLLLGTQ